MACFGAGVSTKEKQRVGFADSPANRCCCRSVHVLHDSTGHRHPLAGAIVGAVAGVAFAYVHAQNDARKCQGQSCEAGPNLEVVFTVPLFGVAGAVIGGFIGWMIRTE